MIRHNRIWVFMLFCFISLAGVFEPIRSQTSNPLQLLFTSDRTGTTEIYSMNISGSNLRAMTAFASHGRYNESPIYSAITNQIAHISQRDRGFSPQITIMNTAGLDLANLNRVELTNDFAIKGHVRWSPNGTRLAFSADPNLNRDIYVFNADGSNPLRLTTDLSADSSPSWSPSGLMIAFQSSRDDLINRTSEIYVMSADGTNQTQLTFNTWSDNTPTWSPDGNKILFSSKQNGENYNLYLMDANGANITALTQNSGDNHNPEWSPDGTMIAFSSNRDGDYEIYVMNANGTNIQQLTHNTDYDGEPTWWLPPPTTLTTTLTLGGRGTPPNAVHSIPLTADLYQNGVLVTPHIPTTTTAGAFTLPNIAQGLYTLWVKPPQYLAVAPSVNLNAPAVSLDAGTLKAGDAVKSKSFFCGGGTTMRYRLIFGMIIVVYFLGTNISAQALQGYSVTMSALQVRPDGTQIAVATVSGSLKIYDATTPTVVIRTLQASGDNISDLGWSPDGTRIAAITFQGRVSVWTSSGSSLYSIVLPSPNTTPQLVSVSWSPNGEQLAVSGQGLGTVILEASTGVQLFAVPTGETYESIWSPSISLVASSYTGVFVWENNSATNKLPSNAGFNPPGIYPGTIGSSRNGDLLAIVIYRLGNPPIEGLGPIPQQTELQIRQFPSLALLRSIEVPGSGAKIKWNRDNTLIALSSYDDMVRIFEASTLRLVDEINVSNSIKAFDWMNNSHIVYASNDGTLNVVGFTTDLTTTLTLGGRGTPPNPTYAIPLTADLYQNGVLVTANTPTTTTAGTFALPNIPQSNYVLWVKPPQYLAVAPSVNLNAPAVSVNLGTLKAGDANNDNTVTINDFTILSNSFGKSVGQVGYDARADFNADTLVNILDYSLLATNFGQSGVNPPTPSGGLTLMSSPQTEPTGDAALVLSPSRRTIQAGTTFEFRAQVQRNIASVDAVELHLAFDPALLQVEAVTAGRFLPYVLQNQYDNSAGTIDFAAGALEEIPAGRFNTVTIRLRALAPAVGVTLAVNNANVTFGGASVYGGATVTPVTVR